MALSLDSSNKRRGRRGRGRRALAEINVTPMVDVMLVLLIIFMISAPLLTAGIDIELPKTEAGSMSDPAEPLNISIQADGSVYVEESVVPFANLAPVLTGLAEGGFERPIYVRADGQASYEVVAQVMAAIQVSGFTQIGLVTETGGPSSGARDAGRDDAGG